MMRIRRGVDHDLEAAADAILFPVLKAITRPSERDVLTHYMFESRRRREVYVNTGAPDAALRRGQFNRAYNPQAPHLNSRDCGTRQPRLGDGREINTGAWIESGARE